jgi:glutaminyl-peptide cyclotransferase
MINQKAMRNICLFCMLTALFLGVGACQQRPHAVFQGERALAFAAKQMTFGPRIPGSTAHRMAGDWIVECLEETGWETELQEFTYQEAKLRNIIGSWEPGSGERPILLGAHYDTRPVADRDDEFPLKPVPGANDGASGVAVLLELARVIAGNRSSQDVWLVFFDGEDSGGLQNWDWVVGSSYFALEISFTPSSVIIVDMVGDRDLNLYFERNSTPELAQSVWQIANTMQYEDFIPVEKYALLDDHTPFLERGFQAIDIIDFDYPYWHTTEDTIDKISSESLEQVGRTLQAWLEAQP